jgi:hypothetical protein
MGKKAKSLRSLEKMKARRAEKAQRKAAYQAMAGSEKNVKRKFRVASKKINERAVNIGDLARTPSPAVVEGTLRLYKLGQYRGRHRALLASIVEARRQERMEVRAKHLRNRGIPGVRAA